MAAAAVNSEATDKFMPLSEGKTFWDEGSFDPVVKRIEHGKRSLNEFMFMVEERADIERRYADKLQSWYTKWVNAVKQGSEYGEVEQVWLSVLKEGRKIADIHFQISSKLGLTHNNGIIKRVYDYKHAHFHKQPLLKELRETKECREAFKAIQAPYKKSTKAITELKKKYMEASKHVLQLTNKLKDKDTQSASMENSKLDALNETKEKAKCKYIESLNSFNDNVKDTYVKEMKAEFQRSQDMEKDRMTLLLNSLHDYIGIVNQQNHAKETMGSIYSEAVAPLTTAKPERNLMLFSKKYGVNMSQNFPKFEDADLEPVRSQLQTETESRRTTSIFADFKPPNPNMLLNRLKHLRSDSQLRANNRSSRKDFMLRRPSQADSISSSAHTGEDFKESISRHSFDSLLLGKPAILKKSSHDGVLKETSTSREVIYQIRGDENGWCYGRIACKEGVYPSNAVRLLTMNIFGI